MKPQSGTYAGRIGLRGNISHAADAAWGRLYGSVKTSHEEKYRLFG